MLLVTKFSSFVPDEGHCKDRHVHQRGNPETIAALSIEDTGHRRTKQENTTQNRKLKREATRIPQTQAG